MRTIHKVLIFTILAVSISPLHSSLSWAPQIRLQDNLGWISWMQAKVTNFSSWLYEGKTTAQLSQQLIQRLDKGDSLADVMVTKKCTAPRAIWIGPFCLYMSNPSKPHFFYRNPTVAQKVMEHATDKQINIPSTARFVDVDQNVSVNPYKPVYVEPTAFAPALNIALRWGETDIAKYLLVKKNANPNQHEHVKIKGTSHNRVNLKGSTALHYAACYKDPSLMELLVVSSKMKVISSIETALKDPPITLPNDVAQLLVSFAPPININALSHSILSYGFERMIQPNSTSFLPLHVATEKGSLQTLNALLKHNPDPLIKSTCINSDGIEINEKSILELLPTDCNSENKNRLISYTKEFTRRHALIPPVPTL